MNWKDEQSGSSNHSNMREPGNLKNQAAGRSTHERPQQQSKRQSRQDADPYDRDVPEPTNRSALGDQSANL
jgi:hypothetical protein